MRPLVPLILFSLKLFAWALASPTSYNNTLLSRAPKKYNNDCPDDFCGPEGCPDDYTGKYTHPMGRQLKLEDLPDGADHVTRPYKYKENRQFKCWDEYWVKRMRTG